MQGEILANELVHYAQNWSCKKVCTCDHIIDNYCFDAPTHSINSNLVLNATRRSIPYALYYTENSIVALEAGDIVAWPGYGAALGCYRDHISEILSQLNVSTKSEDIIQPLYRGLFIEVFSTLELFLSDVILCVIYSDENVFDRAKAFYKMKKVHNEQLAVLEVEKRMHEFFFKGVVYHKFDVVNKMFKKTIGVGLPCYERLNRYLHKRNNIAHRYALSSLDRMEVTNITKEDIMNLIDESNAFADQLIENLSSNGIR